MEALFYFMEAVKDLEENQGRISINPNNEKEEELLASAKEVWEKKYGITSGNDGDNDMAWVD